ncbi:MAG: hypothetical protein ACFFC3_01475, partial [Candidatus Odinarchaeota archaeon]
KYATPAKTGEKDLLTKIDQALKSESSLGTPPVETTRIPAAAVVASPLPTSYSCTYWQTVCLFVLLTF